MVMSLLPPNSNHMMIHLEGYNCSVCTYSHGISCIWQIANNQNLQNKPTSHLNWGVRTEDANTIAESVYAQGEIPFSNFLTFYLQNGDRSWIKWNYHVKKKLHHFYLLVFSTLFQLFKWYSLLYTSVISLFMLKTTINSKTMTWQNRVLKL